MTKKHSRRPKPAHVAAYGAALSTLALAPQAQASSIVALHANPNSVAYGGGTTIGLFTSGSSRVFSFLQYNDNIGKSLITSIYSSDEGTRRFGGLIKLTSVSNSPTLGSFGPGAFCTDADGSAFYGVCLGPDASGTYTFAFSNLIGHTGWFQLNLGGNGNPVTFVAGAYNTQGGDPIHVGTGADSTVPEPAAMGLAGLGLLALGATEIRRRRKARVKQAAR